MRGRGRQHVHTDEAGGRRRAGPGVPTRRRARAGAAAPSTAALH